MEQLVDPDRALDIVLANVPKPEIESCPASEALGRTLARSVETPEDIPPFDRAMMDGFAVRLSDAGREVTIVGRVAAGQMRDEPFEPGQCVEIMTGAPCPPGTEAIVPVEHVTRREDRVRLPLRLMPWVHIQPRGALGFRGKATVDAGALVTPLVLANLAAFGRSNVEVWRRPHLTVITTGDELAGPDDELAPGAIRDSNGPMLAAMATLAGAAPVDRLRARDDETELTQAIEKASDADIVVLSGGVSMGRYDLVPAAAEAAGFVPLLHKVSQKPGKPFFFAVAGRRLLFGLPGNPRSSHFCFHRYVAAAIRKMTGRAAAARAGRGELLAYLNASSMRTLWVPLVASFVSGGIIVLEPFDEQGSADIFSTSRANAYLRLGPGKHYLEPGTKLTFEWTCDAFIS